MRLEQLNPLTFNIENGADIRSTSGDGATHVVIDNTGEYKPTDYNTLCVVDKKGVPVGHRTALGVENLHENGVLVKVTVYDHRHLRPGQKENFELGQHSVTVRANDTADIKLNGGNPNLSTKELLKRRNPGSLRGF